MENNRILVVEDDALSRRMLAKLLRGLGFVVTEAGTVAEGMAMLDGQCCVVLDLDLPDGAGTELLRRVREENRPIRIAIYSGSHDLLLTGDAARGEPDGFFEKPINLARLVAWLKKADHLLPEVHSDEKTE